ncbi:c-type cytochrome [Rhodoferax sp. GW822-FHT02A01]|uniref:c-type cytochrome n=1 Tax=Rhodoferax sp. GW822-FHT02A01 TaxID=3141537 RepID=UPI00315D1F3E
MADLPRFFKNPDLGLPLATGQGVLRAAVMASALALLGCAGDVGVTIENTQAAQEAARLSRPPGSIYTGWRVFQDRCASCHGPDATGTGRAPDLLPRVQQMGPRRFVGLVLKRYDWNLPPPSTTGSGPSADALIDDVLQRKEPVITMPAWEGNPSVSAHIADLYAYLSARAEGTQGKGRPIP